MTTHSIEGLSDGGLREKIARVIDPNGWFGRDNYISVMREMVERGQCAAETVSDVAMRRVAGSLAKADAILALSAAPERVEGGGMDSSSQSQPSAEKGPQPFSHDAPLSDGKGG